MALEADYYFAHPYASWQRGLNENSNGLIRQYLPKGCDFDAVSDEYLARIMARLNHRPRKCLAMKTPYEVFFGKSHCCTSEFNPPEVLWREKILLCSGSICFITSLVRLFACFNGGLLSWRCGWSRRWVLSAGTLCLHCMDWKNSDGKISHNKADLTPKP